MRYKVDEIAIATLIGNTPFFRLEDTGGRSNTDQTGGEQSRRVGERQDCMGDAPQSGSRRTAQ